MSSASRSLPADLLAREFSPTSTFLNTATYGLEPATARTVANAYDDQRSAGTLDTSCIDGIIDSCRELIGMLFGRAGDEVAISASTSQVVGLVAHSLPPGASVLLAEGDFTSVMFPFLAREDLAVEVVALPDLAAAVTDDTDLVAVSAVQSADGELADLDELAAAATAHDTRLLLDVTQAAGWLPLHDVRADYVVGAGYKWLCSPRGTAFITGEPDALASLRPLAANWYAGDDRWAAIYGTPLRLAEGVRRLDLSPAWACWIGMEPALRLLHEIGVPAIHAHNVGLANQFRQGLGLDASTSAIVSVEVDPDHQARLAAADVRTAARAGRVRFSFHLYNTEADVEKALSALR
jgi:selenocysteine lyase/cysteine desulfurase